jgi:diguanylate cyclase (GGDEF)-like protein
MNNLTPTPKSAKLIRGRRLWFRKAAVQAAPTPFRTHLLGMTLLICIELLLAFSACGYIVLPPISMTTIHLPVLLAAIFFGKWDGALMGLIFGLTSIIEASIPPVTPADAAFSPWASGNPWGSLVTSVGTRIAFGFCAGYIYSQCKKQLSLWLSLTLGTFLSTFLHVLFVYASLGYFFPETGITALNSLVNLSSFSGLISYVITILAVLPIFYLISFSKRGRQVTAVLTDVEYLPYYRANLGWIMLFIAGIAAITLALIVHFIQNVQNLLGLYDQALALTTRPTLTILGFQFILGTIAMCLLLSFVFTYFMTVTARSHEKSETDPLTGVYNKTAVANLVGKLLARSGEEAKGFFIMLDLDHFKDINDRYGHLLGDKILIAFANILTEAARKKDFVGRMGGDEFCLYLAGNCSRERLSSILSELALNIRQIQLPEGGTLSSSFGICPVTSQTDFLQIYQEADTALYEAKNTGRNRWCFAKPAKTAGPAH